MPLEDNKSISFARMTIIMDAIAANPMKWRVENVKARTQ